MTRHKFRPYKFASKIFFISIVLNSLIPVLLLNASTSGSFARPMPTSPSSSARTRRTKVRRSATRSFWLRPRRSSATSWTSQTSRTRRTSSLFRTSRNRSSTRSSSSSTKAKSRLSWRSTRGSSRSPNCCPSPASSHTTTRRTRMQSRREVATREKV